MDYAKRVLTFYFKTLFIANGLSWSSDNEAEIEGAVEILHDTIKREVLEGIKSNNKGIKCNLCEGGKA